MTRMSPEAAELLRAALVDAAVRDRYRALISPTSTPNECRLWTGAVSGRGHGRLWIGELADGRDVTVIAHRYGWGLAHGFDALMDAAVVRHDCDVTLCQNVDHLRIGGGSENRRDWSARRAVPGSPLHDRRGSLGRALAMRAAVRSGGDIGDAIEAGLTDLDRYQPPLWDTEDGSTVRD